MNFNEGCKRKMHSSVLIWLIVALVIYFGFRVITGNGVIARGIRTVRIMNAAMAAYRKGNYETALHKAEGLKGASTTAEYYFFRGSILYHLGRFDEAEASLRDGLPLEEDPRQKALVYNTLASVLMEQRRFPEAIAFYENAGRAWPDRGSNHSGIAEIWLRQGRELTEALARARQAVEIDRNATGIKKEALHTRLGEDLVVLAWAVAANSGDVREVESLLSEAFPLCGTKTTPVLGQIHYHAGKAYEALKMPEKSHEHFRQATELDPHGTWGHLSQASLS
jgi:tetratricopeptide (TPR) repeat protein